MMVPFFNNYFQLGDWTSENEVVVLRDVTESAKWKLEVVKDAQQSLELSGNYCGGVIFRKFLSEVKQVLQKRSAVKVHILASDELLEAKDTTKLEKIRKKFGERFFYFISHEKLKESNNHVKCLVVDGKICILGGTSLQDNLLSSNPQFKNTVSFKSGFMPSACNDMDFVVKGKIAECVRIQFFQLLRLRTAAGQRG